MNKPNIADPSTGRSINPMAADDAQALWTGLELARASQLTMLRLQLALHKSNRRSAMQALDNLLDVDAEMEVLAATLIGGSPQLADDVALSGFIGLQKAAIASEKHVLTGGDWPGDARPHAIAAPGDCAEDIDLPVQPPLLDDALESDDQAGGRHWAGIFAALIVVFLIGLGLTAYLWPALPDTLHRASQILTFASGTG